MSGPLIPHDGTEDLRKQGWGQPKWTGLLGFTHLFQYAFLFVPGRGLPLVDDGGGWNTVPISKGSRPIDTSRLTKITKVRCVYVGGDNVCNRILRGQSRH